MQWVDFRLIYDSIVKDSIGLQLDGNVKDKLWIPNMYFPHGKRGIMHSMVRDNIQLQVFEKGTIKYSHRYVKESLG